MITNSVIVSRAEKVREGLVRKGMIVPKDAEFYMVFKDGRIGMKVGEYTHSCHIDTSDFVVLFFEDSRLSECESFDMYFKVEQIKMNR